MIDVKFQYQSGVNQLPQHCTVINATVNRASNFLELPERLIVVFLRCSPRIMGGVDQYAHNKIGLNASLELKTAVEIMCHELIHVEQRLQNKLTINSDGWYFWLGKPWTNGNPELLPQHKYLELPWEADVRNRLPLLLRQITAVDGATPAQ